MKGAGRRPIGASLSAVTFPRRAPILEMNIASFDVTKLVQLPAVSLACDGMSIGESWVDFKNLAATIYSQVILHYR